MFSATLTSVALGLTAFLLCLWLIRRPRNLPPGPWGLPLIGYRFDASPAHEQYAKLAQKYGPVFSVKRGPYLAVILNDSASVRQALVKQADAFSKRFVPGYVKWMLPATNKDVSLIWGNGKTWGELKKFSVSTLRTFGMGKSKSLEPQINQEARELCDDLAKRGGRPTDVTHLLNKTTGNVMFQLIVGRRYDYDDTLIQEIISGSNSIVSSIPHSDPVRMFPSLLHLPIKRYIACRDGFDRVRRYALSQLESHRESFQADNIRDFIDAYFADGHVSEAYQPKEFWRVPHDLFLAGTETTASTLSWVIVYLAVHREVQIKVQAELDRVVGQGRQPSVSDRLNLPYCDATLLEIMRMCPVGPTALPHVTAHTVSLGEYVIPRGTIVIPNVWAVHHDPSVWKDPDVFDPTRFLGNDGNVVERNDVWMPFSVGPRECPGSQLAKIELFLLFTNLFQRFDFHFPPGRSHSLNGVHGTTSSPEPYTICAIER